MTARDRGSAGLELVAMLPLLFLGALLALQVGAVGWTAVSTSEAAREAARAASLGGDSRAAAADSLPGPLAVAASSRFDGPRVELDVHVPVVVPGFSYTVTRTAEMP